MGKICLGGGRAPIGDDDADVRRSDPGERSVGRLRGRRHRNTDSGERMPCGRELARIVIRTAGRTMHVGVGAVVRAARVNRVMDLALAICPVAGLGLVPRSERDTREQPEAQQRRNHAARVRAPA